MTSVPPPGQPAGGPSIQGLQGAVMSGMVGENLVTRERIHTARRGAPDFLQEYKHTNQNGKTDPELQFCFEHLLL